MGFFKSEESKLKEELEKQKIIEQKLQNLQEKQKQKDELEQEKLNTHKLFNVVKREKAYTSKGFVARFKDRFYPHKTMLIHMELRNGMHSQFIVKIKNNQFNYQGATYIIDDDFKYYDISSHIWALDYHQDFAMPVKRKIPLNIIKKTISLKGITDTDTAINPLTLKQFIESEVIQKVMKGEEMDRIFKFLRAMITLNVILSAITLLLFVQSSGMLQNLHLPFL